MQVWFRVLGVQGVGFQVGSGFRVHGLGVMVWAGGVWAYGVEKHRLI